MTRTMTWGESTSPFNWTSTRDKSRAGRHLVGFGIEHLCDQDRKFVNAGQRSARRVLWETPLAFCGDMRPAPNNTRSNLRLGLT
jgi:hypothetical protein